jgi:hypothetical protein
MRYPGSDVESTVLRVGLRCLKKGDKSKDGLEVQRMLPKLCLDND